MSAAAGAGWGPDERPPTPDDLERLSAFAALEFEPAPGQDSAVLESAAWACLNDPDPAVRDGLAYPTLASLLDVGALDDHLEAVGDRAAAGFRLARRHTEPLGVPAGQLGDPYALRRSFSALVLGEVVARGRVVHPLPAPALEDSALGPAALGHPLLGPSALGRWLLAWAAWYPAEPSTASHDPARGWLHAPAHGADVARELALHPQLSPPELTLLLQVLAARLRSLERYLNQTEDDRLALAALAALTRPQLEAGALTNWLASLTGLWAAAAPPYPPGAVLARGVLHSLHLLAGSGVTLADETLPPASATAQAQIRAALLTLYPYATSP